MFHKALMVQDFYNLSLVCYGLDFEKLDNVAKQKRNKSKIKVEEELAKI